ncbi:MAG: oligoribonuclease [Arenicellales bacterium]
MTQNPSHLVWLDLEMTGLEPDSDRIIEIATVVTNAELEILGEGPVLAIHQSEETMAGMDEWNQKTHSATGLISRVAASSYSEIQAEEETLAFLSKFVSPGASPLCGNSICQDRRFLARHMPRLEKFFHYRNLDVSSVKELAARWRPDLVGGYTKSGGHRALNDVLDSIEELRFYRTHFFRDQLPQ